MANLRPIQWARQEDLLAVQGQLEALEDMVDGLERRIGALALSDVNLYNGLEEIAGNLQAIGEAFFEEEDDGLEDLPLTEGEARELAEQDREPDDHELARASDDGMPEPDEDEKAARQRDVRRRRRAALEEQDVLRDFERANETPAAERSADPNDVVDVPEEGVVVDPGYNWADDMPAEPEPEEGS